MFKRISAIWVGVLAAACVAVLVFMRPTFWRLIELKTYDHLVATRTTPTVDAAIVHVDIGDDSIEDLGEWPFSRSRHAQLIRTLTDLDARVIAFDIEFTEQSPEHRDTNGNADQELRAAIQESGRVILPVRLSMELGKTNLLPTRFPYVANRLRTAISLDAPELQQVSPSDISEWSPQLNTIKDAVIISEIEAAFEEDPATTVGDIIQRLSQTEPLTELSPERRRIKLLFNRYLACQTVRRSLPATEASLSGSGCPAVIPPIRELAEVAAGFGVVNAQPDPEDGIIRRVSLLHSLKDRKCPGLALAAYLYPMRLDSVREEANRLIIKNSNLRDSIFVPIEDKSRALISWPEGSNQSFQETLVHVKYSRVIEFAEVKRALADNFSRSRRPLELAKLREMKRKAVSGPENAPSEQEIAAQRKAVIDAEEEYLSLLERIAHRDNKTAHLLKTLKSQLARKKKLSAELADAISGRAVIVGAVYTGSTDFHSIPLAPAGTWPGMMVHSAVFHMLSARRFIKTTPVWMSAMIAFLVGIAGSFVVARSHLIRAASYLLLAAFIAYLTARVLMGSAGLFFSPAGVLSSLLVCFGSVTTYRQMTEERTKRKYRQLMQYYMSPVVVEELLKNIEELKLGGERREITVYFSDLAGFTTTSENLSPEELVSLLNRYLTLMSDSILELGGVLDKYQGDAIMAFFGAPLDQPDQAVRACQAALRNRNLLEELKIKLATEGVPILRQRIGINTGLAVVGNMGSERKFDYTALGDAVNLASRLEATNKAYDTEILVGERTFELAREYVEAREIDLVRVVGRREPVRVFELFAEKGSLTEEQEERLSLFSKATLLYRQRRWQESVSALQELNAKFPNDGPAAMLLRRCEEFVKQPPPPDWDGVYNLRQK